MSSLRPARVNVRFLVILCVTVLLLGAAAVGGRALRNQMLASSALEEGRKAYADEQWGLAAKQLKRYLAKHPEDADALGQYAQAELRRRPLDAKRVNAAVTAYRRLLQLRPDSIETYQQLARLYSYLRSDDELAYIAREWLKRDANDARAVNFLASALLAKLKRDEARDMLAKLVQRLEQDQSAPAEHVKACHWLAAIEGQEYQNQICPAAFEWIRRAVEHNPTSAEALVRRAHFHRLRGLSAADEAGRRLELSAAKADLEKIEALSGASPAAGLSLCQEWIALGEFDHAKAALDRCAQADPRAIEQDLLDPDDWISARFIVGGELALRTRDLQGGAGLADAANSLAQRRHRLLALPRMVELYAAAGRVDTARERLNEFLELLTVVTDNPPRQEVSYLQALVARAEGDSYAVINILAPLASLTKTPARVWAMLAEAYSATDQPRRAAQALEKYVALEPRDMDARVQLGREYLRLGDWNRASELARLARAGGVEDIEASLILMESEVNNAARSESDEARQAALRELRTQLTELQQANPTRSDVRMLRAMAALAGDDPPGAIAILEQAIAECEDTLPVETQLARLLIREQRPADALRVAEQACERHPSAAEPRMLAADLRTQAGDADAALRLLDEAAAGMSDRVPRRLLAIKAAMLRIRAGDRATGASALRTLAQEEPRDLQVRSLLLGLPETLSDATAAQQVIDEIRAAEGEMGVQWRLQQAAFWLAGPDWRAKQEEIAKLLRRCIDADPDWTVATLLLGSLYERQGALPDAEAVYRAALQDNASAIEVADRLLNLLAQQGRHGDQLDVLASLQISQRARSDRQLALDLRAGRVQEALEGLETRVESDTQDAAARLLLARMVYARERDAQRALRYLEEAEQISGLSAAALAARVAILRAEGRVDDALAALDERAATAPSFETIWMRAAFLQAANQTERAASDFKRLIEMADGGRGYELLGAFYEQTGRFDQAFETWKTGLERHPGDDGLQRRVVRGHIYRDAPGDLDQAAELLDALQAAHPNDPVLLQLRASLQLASADVETQQAGLETLRRVVELDVRAVRAHLSLINELLKMGQLKEAREQTLRALSANPEQPDLLLSRAQIELLIGDAALAAELARSTLTLAPTRPEALTLLVEASERLGRPSGLTTALEAADKAVQLDPKSESLRISRARALNALGRGEEAIESLRQFQADQPAGAGAATLVMLSDLRRAAGQHEEADQEAEQARQAAPTDPAALMAKILALADRDDGAGMAALASGPRANPPFTVRALLTAASFLLDAGADAHRPLATELLDEALAQTSPRSEAFFDIAGLLYRAGAGARAVSAFRQGLAANPQSVRGLNDLAWILCEQGELDEALALANQGVRLDPEFPHLRDTRGAILARMPGRLRDARRDFEMCVQLTQRDQPRLEAPAQLSLARVCIQLEDREAARRALDAAARLDAEIGAFNDSEKADLAELRKQVGDG